MPARIARSQIVAILVTCPNRTVADTIARTLVEERLAACVNVVPGLTSFYRWEGKVCRDAEILLVVKTRRGRFAALARRIQTLHPYTVPEIIALPITTGSRPYLSWVKDSTR